MLCTHSKVSPHIHKQPSWAFGRDAMLSNSPNNERRSERILPNLRREELVRESDVGRGFIFDEAVEVVGHEDNVVHAPAHLGEVRFERRLSEIPLACFDDEVLVVVESGRVMLVCEGC